MNVETYPGTYWSSSTLWKPQITNFTSQSYEVFSALRFIIKLEVCFFHPFKIFEVSLLKGTAAHSKISGHPVLYFLTPHTGSSSLKSTPKAPLDARWYLKSTAARFVGLPMMYSGLLLYLPVTETNALVQLSQATDFIKHTELRIFIPQINSTQ